MSRKLKAVFIFFVYPKLKFFASNCLLFRFGRLLNRFSFWCRFVQHIHFQFYCDPCCVCVCVPEPELTPTAHQQQPATATKFLFDKLYLSQFLLRSYWYMDSWWSGRSRLIWHQYSFYWFWPKLSFAPCPKLLWILFNGFLSSCKRTIICINGLEFGVWHHQPNHHTIDRFVSASIMSLVNVIISRCYRLSIRVNCAFNFLFF